VSGDNFPNKYFPKRYFPELYFQGGEQNPGSMSASLAGTSSLVGSLSYIDHGQTVIEAPSQSTGGGGAAHWYRGKYRGELRNTIRKALTDLTSAKDKRKRKKVARKVAEIIRPAFDFWPAFPAAVRVELAPLEQMRIQLVRVAYELKAAEDKASQEKLARLLQEYEDRARKIERQEEEMVIATILLAA